MLTITPCPEIQFDYSILFYFLQWYNYLMPLKKIFNQLNFIHQCQRYGLSLWQCPSFLFLIMGIVIIASTLITYFLGTRYIENPEIVALVVLLLTTILFIIAFIITRSFEKLAETNRLKSEFVRIVTHQLRAPLTNLNWTVDILMSGELGQIADKQVEYFRILKENSNRMEELVRDLVIVSRIEEGSLVSKKEKISLEKIIKNSILKFQHFATALNVEIEFEAEENLAEVFIDPHHIEIAIENLLENAIRYTKRKGRIQIRLERKAQNLYFEIKDNGLGIPREDQKFIFQKFFRSKKAIRQETQGSGLGLFITKSIIEQSGGKIGFQSEENQGSTFWFTLPIK